MEHIYASATDLSTAVVADSREQRQGMEPILLRPEQAAEALNVSRSTIYQLLRRNEITSIKIGAARRIRPEALREYVERNSPDYLR